MGLGLVCRIRFSPLAFGLECGWSETDGEDKMNCRASQCKSLQVNAMALELGVILPIGRMHLSGKGVENSRRSKLLTFNKAVCVLKEFKSMWFCLTSKGEVLCECGIV